MPARHPLLAVAGLVMGMRDAAAPRFVRAYVAVTSLGLIVAAVYAAGIGWIPLMTWNM